ncbi:MAG: pentapeptide repeat-containing protein [Planctomycetaceae bacterium]|nr:pentapeptide repeat-containing protein [Planctomycetaceae bacterium]
MKLHKVRGGFVTLEDGADLSGQQFFGLHILGYSSSEATIDQKSVYVYHNVKFDKSMLADSWFSMIKFTRCSFRGAGLSGTKFQNECDTFEDCDFTDAIIHSGTGRTYFDYIKPEYIMSTKSYKEYRDLSHVDIEVWDVDDERKINMDFTNFNLTGARFPNVKYCTFENAEIEGATLPFISYEELCKTKSFKNGLVNNVSFSSQISSSGKIDYSSSKTYANKDFSKLNLTGCSFEWIDFSNTNFTDSVISSCKFRACNELTIDQIKSTWNYKNNRMTGITLPPKIQKILDAEKQTPTNATAK